METTMKHFLALVPMGGQHEGKIGQHSTMSPDLEAAKRWAQGRFNRPAVVVQTDDDSISSEEAERLYNEGIN